MELAVGQPDDPHISQRFALTISWKWLQFRIVAESHGICSGTHLCTFPGNHPLLTNFRFRPLTWLAGIFQVIIQTANAKRKNRKQGSLRPSSWLSDSKTTLHSSRTRFLSTPYTLHPAPCTLHPTPYTLRPTPYTLHPTPHTQQPTTHTLHSTPHTLNPKH